MTALLGQWAIVPTAACQTNAAGTLVDDVSVTTFVGRWVIVPAAAS